MASQLQPISNKLLPRRTVPCPITKTNLKQNSSIVAKPSTGLSTQNWVPFDFYHTNNHATQIALAGACSSEHCVGGSAHAPIQLHYQVVSFA
jgi:hypothetical protein